MPQPGYEPGPPGWEADDILISHHASYLSDIFKFFSGSYLIEQLQAQGVTLQTNVTTNITQFILSNSN